MKKENKYIVGIITGILVIIAGCLGSNNKITNFDECVEAGNPVMESYPRQCKANGVTYTEEINEQINLPELFRQKAIDKLGVIPVEGFDPDMYLGTFKGLTFKDFDNTEAIGGEWTFRNNKLELIRNTQDITSADGTLTDKGILTLINNLKIRLNIEVNTKEDLDKLIALISSE